VQEGERRRTVIVDNNFTLIQNYPVTPRRLQCNKTSKSTIVGIRTENKKKLFLNMTSFSKPHQAHMEFEVFLYNTKTKSI
jgi:hypothetical protein